MKNRKMLVVFSASVIAALLCSLDASAATVAREDVKSAARAWVHRGQTLGAKFVSSEAENPVAHTTTNGVTFYTVRMNGGGTVFMASDDEYEPILGFTSDPDDFGTIDPKSPLWALLNGDVSRMQPAARPQLALATTAAAATQRAKNANARKWATLIEEGETLSAVPASPLLSFASAIHSESGIDDLRVPALVKSKWSQSLAQNQACYNYYTPNGHDPAAFVPGSTDNSVCGCVATAMSQIMRCLKFPNQPVSQVTHECKFEGGGKTTKMNLTTQGGTYDWDNMPLLPSTAKDFGETNCQAIGKLTSDAGIAVWMSYSVDGSGACTPEGGSVLKSVFGFQNAVCYSDGDYKGLGFLSKGTSSRAEVLQRTMFANFDAGHPVLVSIPGHAVVADGYGYVDNVDYVHFNMGWNGQADYWYNIPDLTEAGSVYTSVDSVSYNLFTNAAPSCAVMSGRVFDEDGNALENIDVSVRGPGDVEQAKTRTNARGIWSAVLEAGTYDVVASGDGLVAELDDVELKCPKTTATFWANCDVNLATPSAATGLGNSWGNDIELSEPSVEIEGGAQYPSLNKALVAAQNGDILKIIRPTKLRKSVMVSASCRVIVDPLDPGVTPVVQCAEGAMLTVSNGVAVSFEGVAFTNVCAGFIVCSNATLSAERCSFDGLASLVSDVDSQVSLAGTMMAGEAPGEMSVAGKLTLGTTAFPSNQTITVAANGNITLGAGVTNLVRVTLESATKDSLTLKDALAEQIAIDAQGASAISKVFGSFTCDYATASETAKRLYNVRDMDLGGEAVSATGEIKWGLVSVPLEDAFCIVTTNGVDQTGYRTFSAALRALSETNGLIVVARDVTHTNTLTLTHDLALASVNGAKLTFGPNAGFVIPEGRHLLVTNAVIRGTGDAQKAVAFSVTGGELLLEDGAVLTGFSSRNSTHKDSAYYGGTVVVNPGTFTMRPGSCISNCVSHSQGGAVWAGGAKATVNLLGGKISCCEAAFGGAVYACTKAKVNIAGDFETSDNTKSDGETPSNLYLTPNVIFALTNALAGSVGVSFGVTTPDLNALDANFVALACELTPQALTNSAACFANDINTNLVGGCVEGQIVWTERPVDDGQCDISEARYSVVIDEGGANEEWRYYEWIEDAFEHLDCDATVYCAEGDWIGRDIEIRHAVRLVSFMPDYLGVQTIQRLDDAMVKIVKGGSLTLENIRFSGLSGYTDSYPYYYENNSSNGLFSVDGGSLTLEEGAVVGYVVGGASRASNAVTVFNGGTVTMKSGSTVTECDNEYMDDYETSCGGGILLDRSTGRFEGGAIYNCKAYRAGGLYVANGSTAYISGDFYVGCNYSYKREFAGDDDTSDNIVVSKNSKLVLAGPLASVDPESEDPEDPDPGYVGVNEGMSSDSNCFATVEWEWTDFEELQESAAQFVHDKRKSADPVYYPEWDYWDYSVYGTAVTNWNEKTQRWDARLVWEDSLSPAKGITIDGETYRGAIPAGVTVAVPTAFSLGTTFDGNGKMALSLDGGVAGCWYTVYSTDDLAQPFTEEASIQLKEGETFSYEIDRSKTAKFYKVEAEEGLK